VTSLPDFAKSLPDEVRALLSYASHVDLQSNCGRVRFLKPLPEYVGLKPTAGTGLDLPANKSPWRKVQETTTIWTTAGYG